MVIESGYCIFANWFANFGNVVVFFKLFNKYSPCIWGYYKVSFIIDHDLVAVRELGAMLKVFPLHLFQD